MFFFDVYRFSSMTSKSMQGPPPALGPFYFGSPFSSVFQAFKIFFSPGIVV